MLTAGPGRHPTRAGAILEAAGYGYKDVVKVRSRSGESSRGSGTAGARRARGDRGARPLTSVGVRARARAWARVRAQVTVLLTDMANFDRVNKVYLEYFDGKDGPLPSRMCYAVKELPKVARSLAHSLAHSLPR